MVTARRSDGVWSRAGEFNGDGKARVEGVEEVAQESPQYCFTTLPYYSLLLSADAPCPSDNHFISCVPAEPRLVQGRGRRELS